MSEAPKTNESVIADHEEEMELKELSLENLNLVAGGLASKEASIKKSQESDNK